ncbi:MarR family winged helix-turn-helix transcriptional regulator [Actinoplanes awajinensis]|uniref:MarR family transcriptional regulator n=1 Tax=Actinoplanes awajinensis subsp. mycoplanecinus TaxID=135947 RepID=A0A101JKY0_9ACTN|nr:MarR family transcriptional regulator [Actinoplanes awajinensis]KUL28769.1 MarR family transcriptional regulator [Actinoplanes awajinensis subsp. mycoplanecinus]
MGRTARKTESPDLGMLAARLLFSLQSELFRRGAELGFGDLRPQYGAVLAYLDEEGSRQTELTRLAGRNKQTIGAILDELEKLGYVSRVPDPADRRARLIVPTARGREWMDLSDGIVADIERRHAAELGAATYAAFRETLQAITEA